MLQRLERIEEYEKETILFKKYKTMEIRLLNWNGQEHWVDIPDDTTHITGVVMSGDHVLIYPVEYDTAQGSRMADYFEGSFNIERKDFHKLEEMNKPYDILDIE